ncbi:unnamed protein product, partial [Owenia fusiformis]
DTPAIATTMASTTAPSLMDITTSLSNGTSTCGAENDFNVVAFVVLIVFYVVILAIGVIAGKLFKVEGASDTDLQVVAGRNLGWIVGTMTMAATYAGGGYLNGLAELVSTPGLGLVWSVSPICVFIGTGIGGTFFGAPLRKQECLTMLDPFVQRFGKIAATLLFLITLIGDIFWSASILRALGTSLSIIVGLDVWLAIVISGGVAILYTVVGAMIAVAYTDVVELVFVIVGFCITIPFALQHKSVDVIASTDAYLGEINTINMWMWIDYALLYLFGGIPWASTQQRFLSAKSATHAVVMGWLGGFIVLIIGAAPIGMGIIGLSANWSRTELCEDPVAMGQQAMMLPYVIYYLTPYAVSVVGLGALAAAVMSSVDSSVLSSSSMFTHNIFKTFYELANRKRASQKLLLWINRAAILVVGVLASLVAIFTTSIFGMITMAVDIVYVTMLPQLICSIYIPFTNGYGALTGSVLALIIRLGAGDAFINLDPVIPFPGWIPGVGNLFPVRLLSVTLCFFVTLIVSAIFKYMFESKCIPVKYDIFEATHTFEVDWIEETEHVKTDDAVFEREDHAHDNLAMTHVDQEFNKKADLKLDGDKKKMSMDGYETYRFRSNGAKWDPEYAEKKDFTHI